MAALAVMVAFPVAAGASASWSPAGSMMSYRTYHTATLLRDGTVLVAGGSGASGDGLRSAERYNPATRTWSFVSSMTTGRAGHTATRLPDGRVLVVGGLNDSGMLSSAELYNPLTDTWSPAGSMATPRYHHTATLLPDGTVLVAGGWNYASYDLSSAELYDPLSNEWTLAGSMSTVRQRHTATLLRSGAVLVAGGVGHAEALSSAELYDPVSRAWTPVGSLAKSRYAHTATRLGDGTVLVVGGSGGGILGSVERYYPASRRWMPAESLSAHRFRHTATLLPGGAVLVVGGASDGGVVLRSAEFYNPASGSWSWAADMDDARQQHAATLLRGGKVLVAGGDDGQHTLTTATLYSSVTVSDRTGQYSDLVGLKSQVAPPGIPGRLVFAVDGSRSGLVGRPSYKVSTGAGSQRYQVCLPAGAYPIAAQFTPKGTMTVCSAAATLTVTPEAMTVAPAAHNPVTVVVPGEGRSSGRFVLKATFAQQRDGRYGAVKGTPVTCELVPEAGGAPLGSVGTCSRTVHLVGRPGPAPVSAAFVFRRIPVGSYVVRFFVDNGYYIGQAGAHLTITEPSLVVRN
jgi:hypothetical protein